MSIAAEPQMLLRNPAEQPVESVLRDTLGGDLFALYESLLTIATGEFSLQYEWRYYNDGKSWLFKATGGKKTVFWLSVWDGAIKTSFYFTEKTRPGVLALPVTDAVKERFAKTSPTGKLVPLILDIADASHLNDFREIAKYKAGLR